MEPNTRRTIVISLALVAIAIVVAEVVLRLNDHAGSEALVAIAATAVGAVAGLAVPHVPAPETLPSPAPEAVPFPPPGS